MKKNFLTGLAIVLPIIVTIWVFQFALKIVTKPFSGMIESLLIRFGYVPVLLESYQTGIQLVSQIIVAILLFALIVLTGFAAQAVIVKYFIRVGNKILHQIPLINKIYKAVQDVMHTLFNEEQKTFSQVALIPFPEKDNLSIGLVTRPIDALSDDDSVSVFVPATPNPTMGFLLLFQKKQITIVDLSVEEALKFIVSCGVAPTKFTSKQLLEPVFDKKKTDS